MEVKDAVLSFFVKQYLIPRAQILDMPGFVVFNISDQKIYARQIIFPENFFILLESRTIKEIPDGKKLLYSIGKKFGYQFSTIGAFRTIKQMPSTQFNDYVQFIAKFIEGTYASEISIKTDLEKKSVNFTLKNFVVCNKLGYGYFLPLGAGAGLMAKLFDDSSIEGLKLSCQGTHAPFCSIVFQPYKEFETDESKNEVFIETNIRDSHDPKKYSELNQVTAIKRSSYSFKKYMDAGFFTYNHGIVLHNTERFFIFEVGGIYLISNLFEQTEQTKKILLEVAFETGKNMTNQLSLSNNGQALIDFLSGMGYGDPSVFKVDNKIQLMFENFPWTSYCENSNMTFFAGFFSGILSEMTKRTLALKLISKKIDRGNLEVVFSES